MKLVDRMLKRVGLMRCSQNRLQSYSFGRSLNGPDTVDVVFKNGTRFAGAIDPTYDVKNRKWMTPIKREKNPLLP